MLSLINSTLFGAGNVLEVFLSIALLSTVCAMWCFVRSPLNRLGCYLFLAMLDTILICASGYNWVTSDFDFRAVRLITLGAYIVLAVGWGGS